MQSNASPHCEKVIYLKWGPLHGGSSLHLIKAVNLKIPITVTVGWQQSVPTAGCVLGNRMFRGLYIFALFFSTCMMLPHVHAHVQICLLLFRSTSLFFIFSDHNSLSSSVNITS